MRAVGLRRCQAAQRVTSVRRRWLVECWRRPGSTTSYSGFRCALGFSAAPAATIRRSTTWTSTARFCVITVSSNKRPIQKPGEPGSRYVEVDASPGHPPCRRCGRWLDVLPLEGGGLQTRCPGCHDSASYVVDLRAYGLCAGLVGAVALESRADRATARMDSSGGAAVAVRCPHCGAVCSSHSKTSS